MKYRADRASERVYTGRTYTGRQCLGCQQRIRLGDPKPNGTWAARLVLSREQVDLLLIAASEFEEIGGGSAVEFMDWCSVDATRGYDARKRSAA